MIATAYKCDHLQADKVAFDPYEILSIDSVSVLTASFVDRCEILTFCSPTRVHCQRKSNEPIVN